MEYVSIQNNIFKYVTTKNPRIFSENNLKIYCLPFFKKKNDYTYRYMFNDKKYIIPNNNIFENKILCPFTNEKLQIIDYKQILKNILKQYNIDLVKNNIISNDILNKKITIEFPISYNPAIYDVFIHDSDDIISLKQKLLCLNINCFNQLTIFEKLKLIYRMCNEYTDENKELILYYFKNPKFLSTIYDLNTDKVFFNLYKNTYFYNQQIDYKQKTTKKEILTSLLTFLQLILIDNSLTLSQIFDSNNQIYKDIINTKLNDGKQNKNIFIHHKIEITLLELIVTCDQLDKKMSHIISLYEAFKAKHSENIFYNIICRSPIMFNGQPDFNVYLYARDKNTKDSLFLNDLKKYYLTNSLIKWIYPENSKINYNTQITNIFDFTIESHINNMNIYVLNDMILPNDKIKQYDILSNSDILNTTILLNSDDYINDMEKIIEKEFYYDTEI